MLRVCCLCVNVYEGLKMTNDSVDEVCVVNDIVCCLAVVCLVDPFDHSPRMVLLHPCLGPPVVLR